MRTSDRDALVAQLIAAGHTCVERGLVLASGGNLSVRLEGRGSFVITESGTWLDRLTPTTLPRSPCTVANGSGGARRWSGSCMP